MQRVGVHGFPANNQGMAAWDPERWAHLVGNLEQAGIEHVVHSKVSVYFKDPDGARLELIADPLGEMYGTPVL